MRRATPLAPRLRARLRLPALLAALTLLLYAVARLDAKIQPILQEFAEYETRSAVVRLMNDAVAQEMAQSPERYRELYAVTTGADGGVQTVQGDPQAVNLARASLIRAVTAALDAAPEQRLEIPLGSLLDSAILNDLGPAWTLTIQPRGYVDGELTETAKAVEINRVEYRIDLTLTASVNMILEGRAHVLIAETTVPLVHVLLDGQTPGYYSRES